MTRSFELLKETDWGMRITAKLNKLITLPKEQ